MIDDFEWKIHEIEADYHRKLKDMQAHPEAFDVAGPSTSGSGSGSSEFDRRLEKIKRDLAKQKDEELARMQAQLKKEMEEKVIKERNSYKQSSSSGKIISLA